MEKPKVTKTTKAQESRVVKNKLTLTKKTPFNTKQLLSILQKTPQKHIYKRPAKGGGEWEYVTGVYIKKSLNYVFGFMWSSDVLEIREKHRQIQATVKITVHRPSGTSLLWKTDVGKKDIAFKRGTDTPLDYGNDEKSAITDGIKRCASQLGIASDVYGKEEFREIEVGKMLDNYKKQILIKDGNKPATEQQIATVNAMAKKNKAEFEVPKTRQEAVDLIKKLGEKK